MKLVQIDGLNRETIADVLIKDGLDEYEGTQLLSFYIRNYSSDLVWFRLVPDDYRLWRGMEDLV